MRSERRSNAARSAISRSRSTAAALLMLGAWSCIACQTRLIPADDAQEVPGLRNAASARLDGVRVLAHARDWPGPVSISEEVTPLRIEIENRSEQPLRIRYSEFALVSDSGRRFAALPPFAVEGDAPMVVSHPRFLHANFALAPTYRHVYPGFAVYGHPFAYDRYYYDAYYPYWNHTYWEVALPTPAMVEWGLPEGVIMPGGRLDGWLYFEKLDDEVERVALRADLVDAYRGISYGELRIPFEVD